MTFKITNLIGAQNITDTSSTQKHPLGTIVRAIDSTYGEGEFIYLEGVASTVAGSLVNYDDSFQTALSTTALDHPRPIAVAMSANVASYYGWYQISGISVGVKANTVSLAKGAALAASAGNVIAVVSGRILNGALVAVVASAKSDVTSVKLLINRPHDPSDVS